QRRARHVQCAADVARAGLGGPPARQGSRGDGRMTTKATTNAPKKAEPAAKKAAPAKKAAAPKAAAGGKQTVTLRQLRMPIDQKQALALQGLGLRRIRHEVSREDTPSVRGLILKVRHLVEVVG